LPFTVQTFGSSIKIPQPVVWNTEIKNKAVDWLISHLSGHLIERNLFCDIQGLQIMLPARLNVFFEGRGW
jgi:hypothetical protein